MADNADIAMWELRVHGVSGTPATDMLELEATPVEDGWGNGVKVPKGLELFEMPADDRSRRAFRWGRLTSGSAKHAFYVLLLPFMLCNVAGWMLTGLKADADQRTENRVRSWPVRRCLFWARLAALCVTLQFAAFLTFIVVDMLGRQVAGARFRSMGPEGVPWAEFAAAASVLLTGVLIGGVALLTRVRPLNPPATRVTGPSGPGAREAPNASDAQAVPTSSGEQEAPPEQESVDARIVPEGAPAIDRAGTADLITDQHALWTTPQMARILHRAHVAVMFAGVALLVRLSASTPCGRSWHLVRTCLEFSERAGAVYFTDLVALVAGVASVLMSLGVVVALSLSARGALHRPVAAAGALAPWLGFVALLAAAWAWAKSPAAAAVGTMDFMPGARGSIVWTFALLLITLVFLRIWGGPLAAHLMMVAGGVAALYGAGIAAAVRTPLGGKVDIPSSFGWVALAFVAAAVVMAVMATYRFIRAVSEARQEKPAIRPWVAARAFAAESPSIVRTLGAVGAVAAAGLIAVFLWYRLHQEALPALKDLVPTRTDLTADVAWTLVALLVGCVGRIAWAAVRTPQQRGPGAALMAVALGTILFRWTTTLELATAEPWSIPLRPGLALAVVAAVFGLLVLLGRAAFRHPGSQPESRARRGAAFTFSFLVSLLVTAGVLGWLQATNSDGEGVLVATALTLPVGLILTRLQGALRDTDARKGVAVLWDLATFWPRWFHPFSPPTYSDTAVVGLSQLLVEQLPQRRVLLAPHSQGSVIAVPAILKAAKAGAPMKNLALLTYGSPVAHHYRKLFPALFPRELLLALESVLGGEGAVRWRNLWRRSDPVAGPIDIRGVDSINGVRGMDDPKSLLHSGYWKQTEKWDDAVETLTNMLEASPPNESSGESGDAPTANLTAPTSASPEKSEMQPTNDRNIGQTYLALRVGIVLLVAFLLTAITFQYFATGCLQGSISAYYYTHVQSVFVAMLCAIGACLVVYRGSTDTENVLLDLSGFLAFLVALVPTTPHEGCGTLPGAPLVRSNVAVLLLIGGAAILVGVGMWKGALSRGAKRSFVVSALGWIGGWVFFLGWPETFAARGHVVSAIAMFTGIIAVVIVNAISFKKAYPAKEGTGATINRYMIIAAVMGLTLVTAVVAHLTLAKFDQLVFWLETALIVEFAVFWIMQTQELGVRVARPALRAGAEGDAFDEEGDSARH